MAKVKFTENFCSLIYGLRAEEVLLLESQVAVADTENATKITEAELAEIELHVVRGHTAFEKFKYRKAMNEYLLARSLIYKLLYPGVDPYAIAGDSKVLLPLTRQIESEIVETSLHLAELVRPEVHTAAPLGTTGESVPSINPSTKSYGEVGFHLAARAPATAARSQRSWIYAGGQVASLLWQEGARPAKGALIQIVYEARLSATKVAQLEWKTLNPEGTSAYLLHLYAYVLPVAIGDCLHELGEYKRAEEYYLLATKYTYLNKSIEGVSLWIRLVENAVAWGNDRYLAEQIEEAIEQYGKIIARDSTVPSTSLLYNTAGLSEAAGQATSLIEHLKDEEPPAINPLIAAPIYTTLSRWAQINAGLDYYGLALLPIHTFDYLRQVATAFAKEAIQAEREFINFESRAEAEEATRRELEQVVAMAGYEAKAREELYNAAVDDKNAASAAYDLAVERAANAFAEREAYKGMAYSQLWAQAASTAQGAGSDSWYNQISAIADQLKRGEEIHGERGKLAAAYILWGGRKNIEYELERMQNDIDELNKAKSIAESQQKAAEHRTNATKYGWDAAEERKKMADEALEAFDKEVFTPETWHTMAKIMRTIANNHLERAIRVAKLMERAYHFETDIDLKIIKNKYGFAQIQGLLGADALLLDIEAFTYHSIIHQFRKETRIKDVISLAMDYPYQFEEFKKTGYLAFETDLYDFDVRHPGFYSQRIEAVELEILGFVPPDGLNGVLMAGGVSRYRTLDGGAKTRVHVKDSMALSGYTLRNDAFVFGADTRIRGTFEGLGLGSTWILRLPRRSNNLDYRRIYDIRMVIYYRAMYDELLHQAVVQREPRPGELMRVKDWALRYDFPESWYAFYDNAEVNLEITEVQMPRTQSDFVLEHIYLRVETEEGISNENVELRIMVPGQPPVSVTTNSDGAVSSRDVPSLGAVMGGAVLGSWAIKITGGDSVTENGKVVPKRIFGLRLGIEYNFQWVD